jgi:3-deoxy-7-phosphoheptulonate synthase
VKVEEVLQKLERCSPLVFAGEVRTLQEELAKASLGQGFVLMGGDCAETFKEFNVNHVRDTFRVILQMALVMAYGAAVPVVKIGRMAGQFAKPRSEPDEVIDGVSLPSYRGDILNGEEFTLESRTHNPQRMLDAYHQSSQTLNILRAFAIGGYADISRLHAWNLDFVEQTPSGSRYREMCAKVDESLRFMKAIGVDTRAPTFTQCNFYTAHECLLLPYEQALTRQDSITDKWYDCSAHMLWVGERTRQIDHAHLHFLSGIGNPIGIKVSDKASPEELLELLEIINPDNIPGRVVVIVRMGAEKLRLKLPALIRAVQREGRTVLWMSDPVHGNTIKTDNGFKTRPFDRIRDELRAFFDVHAEMGTHPGGVHLEMTGKDVTECIGGNVAEVLTDNLGNNYATGCDPRLNSNQSLELAFLIAERMRLAQGLEPLFGK